MSEPDEYQSENCDYMNDSAFVVNVDGQLYNCTLAINDSGYAIGRITESAEIIEYEQYYEWIPQIDEECWTCIHLAKCKGMICPFHRKCNQKKVNTYTDTFINTTMWETLY